MNDITIANEYLNDLNILVDEYHSKPITESSASEFFNKIDTLKACRDWALKVYHNNTFIIDELPPLEMGTTELDILLEKTLT
jgi:hypothetical protein